MSLFDNIVARNTQSEAQNQAVQDFNIEFTQLCAMSQIVGADYEPECWNRGWWSIVARITPYGLLVHFGSRHELSGQSQAAISQRILDSRYADEVESSDTCIGILFPQSAK